LKGATLILLERAIIIPEEISVFPLPLLSEERIIPLVKPNR